MVRISCSNSYVGRRNNLILVKENKTWEEAHDHCEAQSDEAWIGLCFWLAGGYGWMGKPVMVSPLLCAQPMGGTVGLCRRKASKLEAVLRGGTSSASKGEHLSNTCSHIPLLSILKLRKKILNYLNGIVFK